MKRRRSYMSYIWVAFPIVGLLFGIPLSIMGIRLSFFGDGSALGIGIMSLLLSGLFLYFAYSSFRKFFKQ